MQFLTYEESERWLNAFHLKIVENRHLSFEKEQSRILITVPREPIRLHPFASKLIEWLPANADHFLWISNWETSPEDQFALFSILRKGCGETRQLIDAPGHLFSHQSNDDSIKAGIMFLLLTFNWEGYLASNGCTDYIYLGDEYVAFFSNNQVKLDEVVELLKFFNINFIDDIRQAW